MAWQNDGIGVRRCCTSSICGCDVEVGGRSPIESGLRAWAQRGRLSSAS